MHAKGFSWLQNEQPEQIFPGKDAFQPGYWLNYYNIYMFYMYLDNLDVLILFFM